MPYENANEIVDELFKSLLSRYQVGLEASMRGSDFIFDSVQLLYYKRHQINVKRGRSYIDSQDWIKKKKSTINPKIDMINVASNFEVFKKDPQRVSNIKPFINKYITGTE